ncbi:MAG: murein biosynthesis integral membrane protein MurJ [Alsobacter sp.]
MLKHILSVGGFTLLSRLTGFIRDVAMAAVMGTGLVADAFVVAQRLPNHFRAIFGEGAFNAAFVPTYSAVMETEGEEPARRLAGRIMTVLGLTLAILCGLAIWFMPQAIDLLAPGFSAEPEKFALAVTLTRITFPYLFFITAVTLISGILNAHDRYASAAAAPILLNVGVVVALAVAYLFPTAGHAAAWGVMASGIAQYLLVAVDAQRHGLMPGYERIRFDKGMRRFFKMLGPAVIGSAGVQIAMFADTIIASLLPTGAVSSLYYADRLYQLPVGVIGIAAGTVVLPTMSRRLALGDVAGAESAQNRAIAFTLVLSAPFTVAFLLFPDLIMRALFMRGAFTAESAAMAGAALAAYAVGLPAVVTIRSAVASFYAREDTATPLIASFSGIAVNLALKLVLFRPYGAAGLAFATAIGAWTNVGLLVLLASRRRWIAPDRTLKGTVGVVVAAAAAMGLLCWIASPWIAGWTQGLPAFRGESHLAVLGLFGLAVYGAVLLALLRALSLPLRRA